MLQAIPLKTEVFKIRNSLDEFLIKHLQSIDLEGKILAVTSKIVSVAENRLVKKSETAKESLVRKEADVYLGHSKYDCHLTIKEGLLIPSAGVDESNSEEDQYILYPEYPFESARNIHQALCIEFKLKNLGVILTDSRTSPLRKGVTGVALAYYGFEGVVDKVGSTDLFGRTMKMTTINAADAIATAATLVMGEGSESCPLAVVEYPVKFARLNNNNELKISLDEDIFHPILSPFTMNE